MTDQKKSKIKPGILDKVLEWISNLGKSSGFCIEIQEEIEEKKDKIK